MSNALLTALALFPALSPIPAEDPPEPSQDPAYLALTNSRRSVTNLNIETIRGMAWDAEQGRLYAVNTHGSTLVYFNSSATPPAVAAPAAIFRTINNPTAVALWEDDGERRYAIVVGGGTHGVAKHDRDTGEIVAYLNLPAEPKDIVIDTEHDWAWVSCAGAFDEPGTIPQVSGGVVMKIELDAFAFTGGTPSGSGQHFIDAMRPTFLNIEIGEGDVENIVYVAPMLSGNSTTFVDPAGFTDMQVASVTGLPDDDLFAIDESGNVTVAAQGVGALITNHARNPASGKYWILNVDSLNAAVHTEAEHRGGFAENTLTSVNLPQTLPAFQSDFLLDGTGATLSALGVAGANKPASFPFGLAIHPTGFGALVSSTGDTLRVIDGTATNGTVSTLRNIGLPLGSIPRGVLLSPDAQALWVYAWGTNRILQYDAPALLLSTTTSVNPLLYDLGVDPLPAAARHGREIFYDADNSLDPDTNVAGKVTCNTCHPAGAMDMLGWDLGDPPGDNKDTMVTQSLLGIEDTFPYHWRGERSLSEFNGAFQFLLGGSQLGAEDLADFEAFVFSLQGAANPRQNVARELDDSNEVVVHTGSTTGSALSGQGLFHNDVGSLLGFVQNTCQDCHGAETGSNGVITPDILTGMATNGNLDVAHLRQLQHKFFQPQYSTFQGSTALGSRPRGGFGFSQDGSDGDILDFLSPAVFFPGPTQTQDRADAASFVLQFDEGIAPRAHDGTYYALDSTTGDVATAADLVAQAQAGHCDLVAMGHFLSGGLPTTPMRLWFDVAAGVFRTSEPGTGYTFTPATMEALRSADLLRGVLLGLPLGNAYRFAVDPDDDALSFLTEASFTSINSTSVPLDPWRADTDGDGFPDGYELELYEIPSSPVSTYPDPGRFDLPSVIVAADTVVPTMGSSATLGFVTARQSKHLVEFNEPVTYEIQVEHRISSTASFQPMGPAQKRPSLRRMDTLIAHHLRPSFDIQGTGGPFVRDDEYRLKVTMTDLAGQQNVEYIPPSSGSFFSDLGVLTTTFLPGTGMLVYDSHQFDAALTGPVSGGYRLVLDADLADIWEGTTPPASLAGGRTMVAQILVETSPGSNEFQLPTFSGFSVTPATGTRFVSSVGFNVGGATWGNSGDPVEGPLLLSPATDSAGSATFDFVVTNVPTGTRVRINMVAILSEDTTPGIFLAPSVFAWQLPMTETEDRFEDITL